MSQEDLLLRFRDYLQYERRYSSHTIEGYCRDIEQFASYYNQQYGSAALPQITHHHIRSWVVSLLSVKTKSVSIRRKLSSLSHFSKWMRQGKLMDYNPLQKVHLPKIPDRLPKALPEQAIRQLWDSFADPHVDDSYGRIRDKVILALLYGSGLRRSELIGLRWQDIDSKRGSIRILGKGAKYRQVPVGIEATSLLNRLKAKQGEAGFSSTEESVVRTDTGKPCYPKFVYNRVVSMLSGVTTSEKKSPHVLRHSMATHLMDHGAELNAVKEILGHSSLAATQVYTHNSITRLMEVYKHAHPTARHE